MGQKVGSYVSQNFDVEVGGCMVCSRFFKTPYFAEFDSFMLKWYHFSILATRAESHGHPFSRAHVNISEFPARAAESHTNRSRGKWFSTAHDRARRF